MKRMKKLLAGVLCATLLLGSAGVTTYAEDGIMPCYDQINRIIMSLTFKDNVATCELYVLGDSDVTFTGGTLILYDIDQGKTIASWPVNANGNILNRTKTYGVVAGHRYRLTYDGIVKSPRGTEYVKQSTTATN